MNRSLVLRVGIGRLFVALAIIGAGMFGSAAVATASAPAAPPQVSASDPGVLSHCRKLDEHPTVRRGDNNLYVSHAQCLLKHHWNQGIAVDWIFGPATEGAVKNVQRWCGLVVDGIVGPNTWRVLHRHGTC